MDTSTILNAVSDAELDVLLQKRRAAHECKRLLLSSPRLRHLTLALHVARELLKASGDTQQDGGPLLVFRSAVNSHNILGNATTDTNAQRPISRQHDQRESLATLLPGLSASIL